jgi:hypothetical protein
VADDTVKRLWHTSAYLRTMEEADIREAIEDAADEIERLRAERDDLHVLLRGRTAELQAEADRLRTNNTFVEQLVAGQLSHRLAEIETELAAERALANELARALRSCIHDRPTTHTDAVWIRIHTALENYEKVRDE